MNRSAFQISARSEGNSSLTKQYWWLNFNPKLVDLRDRPIGSIQTFVAKNEEGNKRRMYKYFEVMRPGDLLLAYQTGPISEIAVLLEVIKGLSDFNGAKQIEIKSLSYFSNSVSLKRLKDIPELQNSEPILDSQGALFRLTEDEFEVINGMSHPNFNW